MRVGFVLHQSLRDGAGIAFLELLDALHGLDIEPVVVVPSSGPLVADMARRGAEVATVPYRRWATRGTPLWKRGARTAWNLLAVAPTCRILHSRRCGAVVTNTITVGTGALAAKVLGLPHVWYVHELWGGATELRFDIGETLALRLVGRLSTTCIAASSAIAAPLATAVGATKVKVLYQSVTLSALGDSLGSIGTRPGSNTLVCLAVGALHPIKHNDDAIRALAIQIRRGMPAELWFVGDGETAYRDSLRGLAGAEGVATAIHFLGFRQDPGPLQRAADVVISGCPVEGFGRATVEGMLAGKPVVAARGGGNDELVRDGVNGLLYESGNPTGLAACLARLAADPAERRRLGDEGRRWAMATFTRTSYGAGMAEILVAATGLGARR